MKKKLFINHEKYYNLFFKVDFFTLKKNPLNSSLIRTMVGLHSEGDINNFNTKSLPSKNRVQQKTAT